MLTCYLYDVTCIQTNVTTLGVVASSPINAVATIILCKSKNLSSIPESNTFHHKQGLTYRVVESPRIMKNIHIKRWRKNAYEADKVQFEIE